MADGTADRPFGLIPLAALALLAERPLHPYEMQRLLHDRHMDYAEGRTRALYRAIDELQEAGWIEPAETTREGRRPERTVYRITEEGHEALEDWLQDELERPAVEHLAFSAAVGLIAHLPQERAVAALKARVVTLRAELAARDEAAAGLAQELRLPRYVLLELEHQRALRDAELTWVLALLEDFHSGRLGWDEQTLRADFQELYDRELTRLRHRAEPVAAPASSRPPSWPARPPAPGRPGRGSDHPPADPEEGPA